MTATAHQVVGLIEIPSDGPWSADALVKECLGVRPQRWDHERVIITGRMSARSPFESARLSADVSQLQSDLQDLLEGYLDNC